MRKKIVAFCATVLMALGLVAFSAAPANAAQYYLKICNSTASQGPIRIYSSNWPGGNTLIGGDCKTYGDQSSIMIDPDPELGPDVDSTWWGFIGEGYDYCDPGEGLINPPSVAPDGIRYNTDASGC